MEAKNVLVDYNVVSELAGHQENKGVQLIEAAKDIFSKVKEKGMQCAVKGVFKTFKSVDDLMDILMDAVHNNYRISVYDEDLGG